MANHDRLQQVVCCILKAASDVLTEAGLTVPDKVVPSHKGLDDHCVNCEGMWGSVLESTDATEVFGDSRECAGMRAVSFQLDLLRQVCTEGFGKDNCGEEPYGGCGGETEDVDPDDPDVDPDEDDDGCCDPIPVSPEPSPCSGDDRPTVAEESARFWRERWAIEKELLKKVKCCLEECHRIRCGGLQLGTVTEATEGGCHYLTVELTLAL